MPISNDNSHTRTPCQICGKISHQALDCYHRMDYIYQGRHLPSQLAAMVAQSNHIFEESNVWYANSGANQHITNEVANLSLQEPYAGEDSVAVGNGSGLSISNIGSFSVPNP